MKQEVRGMKNINDEKLLSFVENEILKHKEDYSEKEIKKLLEIFNEIMNVVPKKANSIGDMYINFIGSDHMAVYYFEYIWTMELLIKILENSSKNRARIIFCLSVLNDLYYFVLDDSDKFSKDKYWSEFRKVKKLLYPYSDKFYDGLLKKMLGIVVEDEVVEKMEEKEVEEEKKLTPQQWRKKYFLKRMKRKDK